MTQDIGAEWNTRILNLNGLIDLEKHKQASNVEPTQPWLCCSGGLAGPFCMLYDRPLMYCATTLLDALLDGPGSDWSGYQTSPGVGPWKDTSGVRGSLPSFQVRYLFPADIKTALL